MDRPGLLVYNKIDAWEADSRGADRYEGSRLYSLKVG